MKKYFSLFLASICILSCITLSGCGKKKTKGEVYFLNFKPESASVYEELAKKYEQEKGVKVKVVTAAANNYEQTLKSEIAKSSAPTIFQVNGPIGYDSWKDYCLDIKDSKLYDILSDKSIAIKDGDGVYGIPYVVEGYGIIYNSRLLATAGFSQDDIRDFTSFADIVKLITAAKRTQGFSAFAAPDLSNTDHGALLCLLAGLTDSEATLRSFWDLYRENCTRSGSKLTQATRQDALNDFLSGKAVFYLGGTWDYDDISKIANYDLGFMPVYTAQQQENPGLYHSSTGYWCVNSQADEMDIQASLDFLNWLVTAQEGEAAPADRLEYLMPFQDVAYAGNPLEKLVLESMRSSQENVHWTSCDTLTPEILRQFGDALIAYTKDPTDEQWAALTALQPGLKIKNPEA